MEINTQTASEWFKNNAYMILNEHLIPHQCSCPKYKHENNIEVGLGYEKCLADACQWARHVSQEVVDYKKRDLEYKCHALTQFDNHHIYESKTYSIEVKTSRSNLHKSPSKVNWIKKNGNESNEATEQKILKTMPDALIVYQKFDIEEGIPAMLCWVGYEGLLRLIDSGKLTQSNTNAFIEISLNDFDWFVVQSEIPLMRPGYKEILDDLVIYFDKLKREKISEVIKNSRTGRVIICDSHKENWLNFQSIPKLEKVRVKNEALSLLEQGMAVYEVAKKVKIRPGVIRKWHQNNYQLSV